jgi:hypothetical protein
VGSFFRRSAIDIYQSKGKGLEIDLDKRSIKCPIVLTCADGNFSGPLARFVTNAGIAAVEPEPSFALVDDIRSDPESAAGRGFTAISVAQQGDGAQAIRAGNAKHNAVGPLWHRATNFTTLRRYA